MKIKKLLLVLFFFSLSFFVTEPVKAISLPQMLTSSGSIITRVREGIEYFFAFRVEEKVAVLERHAEKRLVSAQGYAEEGGSEEVQNLLQNYAQIKEKQSNLLEGTDGKEVLGTVEERTIEQQKIMEEIKLNVVEEVKQEVVRVQERVVNQVAQKVVATGGLEEATEFFQKVEHVWAPGTGPGGEAGVVVEGGTIQFAPGTSAGGNSGADIQNVIVVEGGGGLRDEKNAE